MADIQGPWGPKASRHLPYRPENSTSYTSSMEDNLNLSPHLEDDNPCLLSKSKLNDLVCNLGLTNEKSELLGSRLKEGHLLGPGKEKGTTVVLL